VSGSARGRKDRPLIEARAAGIDLKAGLERPFRQMLHADIIGSAFAISVFLIIYYLAVGFFPRQPPAAENSRHRAGR